MNKNVIDYQSGVLYLKKLYLNGDIDKDDYIKGEKHLAEKYGIKDKSIYRLNNLICTQERVINIVTEKEDNHDGSDRDCDQKEVEEII